MMGLDDLAAAVGVKFSTVIAGAVGSFISLRFFDGLRTFERWTTFAGGWGLAIYGAGPITAYLELKPGMEQGVSLLVGLFGMSIAAAVINTIRDTDWKAILNRKTGGQ